MLSAAEKKSAQVYRWLLAYIDENKFSGNQRLPSENALCRKLGVSRETIRVAIDRLVNEGIVYKVKGSGTYFHREKVMTRDLNTEDRPCFARSGYECKFGINRRGSQCPDAGAG